MGQLEIRSVPVSETRSLRHDVLRPYMTLEQLASHEPHGAFAVGAYDGGELIAVGFIAPDGTAPGSWRVRGMATIPSRRGGGAGSAVLAALLRHATEHGAGRIWCNARVPARTVYERAGFNVVSEEFELPEIGPHYVMELLVGG